MAAEAGKKADKQVMDVSKPGKTPASASSRPIIVGHKPAVQDPMVNTAEDTNPDVAPEETLTTTPSTTKKVISPLSDEYKNEEQATDSSLEIKEPEPEESSEPEKADQDNDSSDSAVVDAVAEQVGANKQEDKKSEEERKHKEEIEKLISEKKYYVSVGSAHRKSGRVLMITTILLLFILIGMLLAIDAGILDAGFNLPFDLIKN